MAAILFYVLKTITNHFQMSDNSDFLSVEIKMIFSLVKKGYDQSIIL